MKPKIERIVFENGEVFSVGDYFGREKIAEIKFTGLEGGEEIDISGVVFSNTNGNDIGKINEIPSFVEFAEQKYE